VSSDLWVFAEHDEGRVPETTLQTLGAARRLVASAGADIRVIALALGRGSLAAVDCLAHGGAHVVRVAEDGCLDASAPEACAGALASAHATAACPPTALLFPATRRGRELGARVAARRRVAFVPDVLALGWRDGQIEARRLAVDGRVEVTLLGGRILVLGPEVGDAQACPGAAIVERFGIGPDLATPRVTLVTRHRADPRTVPLAQADVIVAAGNGVRDFGLVWRFADLVGAAVGGSRIVCDDGRLDPARQIGESGVTVAPRCYLAFGISGASQHVRGMRDSKLVITVNTDRHAPIHDLAALAAIGDAAEVLRALVARLTSDPRIPVEPPPSTRPATLSWSSALAGLQQAGAGRPPRLGAARPPAGLNVVVCASEGVSVNGPLPLDGASRGGAAAPVRVPNPDDERAVEATARLVESCGGGVTVVSVGELSPATRRAYTGLGAGASVELVDEGLDGLEPYQIAWLLAGVIRPLAPDLVVCGERGTGRRGSGLVPFALAELLGLAVVPGALAMRVRGAVLEVERLVERGDREVLATPWPAVVTVSRAADRSRYPALAKARRASHCRHRLADLGLSRALLAALAVGPSEVCRQRARPRPKRFYVPPATMSAADRLAVLMAGGRGPAPVRDGRARFIEGSAATVADTILDYLRHERILDA
jgi:electron transfer flavoprotein alpha subunit